VGADEKPGILTGLKYYDVGGEPIHLTIIKITMNQRRHHHRHLMIVFYHLYLEPAQYCLDQGLDRMFPTNVPNFVTHHLLIIGLVGKSKNHTAVRRRWSVYYETEKVPIQTPFAITILI
jgi:hypothetical protein